MALDKVGPYPREARSALLATVEVVPRLEARPRQMRRVASIIGLVAASVLATVLLRPPVAPPEAAARGGDRDSRPISTRFVDGVHYRVVENPVPTASADRIEVCEFFMFPCVHCFDLEQPLLGWYRQRADIVNLRRVPAIWNATTRLQAQAFFAGQALGIDDVMARFFDEIHVRGGNPDSVAAIRELFRRWGIEESRFDAVFDSDAVTRLVAEAVDLNRRYAIASTPALTVNGRFVTDAGMAGGSHEALFAVIDHLVEVEQQAACARAACAGGR
jgi:thiol:disulfide interchange protein DsbA